MFTVLVQLVQHSGNTEMVGYILLETLKHGQVLAVLFLANKHVQTFSLTATFSKSL